MSGLQSEQVERGILTRHRESAPGVILPRGWARIYRNPRVARLIAKQFSRVFYSNPERTMFAADWLGTQAVKYPTDMWIYQELVWAQKPELIIETGT